ncbi:hypothetical protein DLJ48_05000 [Oenococcus sicerae]|uniref:DUF4064 domain-containing protein n=1 Tax=Oenococcus sicerae TaxID=2203724 RepID=A0AAJ1RAQ8_9LACO|nr:hypothetical protein [Oenococcus sicerae]MDN6900350.1 hypothetical protein [Oenococcus sicerae]QAS69925.1 hypothetical protein DLJ48_05000 [Oenococcus sicerae]
MTDSIHISKSLKIITIVFDFLGIAGNLLYGLITLGAGYMTSSDIQALSDANVSMQSVLLVWGAILLVIPGLIMLTLHLVGLMQFRRAGYSLTGHWLGIAASILSIVMMTFWLAPFVYLLAGIFLLLAHKQTAIGRDSIVKHPVQKTAVTEKTVTTADLYPDAKMSVPNMTNTIVEIKAYLDANDISYKKSARKADLLKLIK